MKILFVCITLFLCMPAVAQKKIFLRFYNSSGKKVNKGYLIEVSGNTLSLQRRHDTASIPMRKIYQIKTRRSAGHSMLIGAAVVGSVGALVGGGIGANFGNRENRGNAITGVLSGIVVGGYAGAAFGGVNALLTQRQNFIINGDLQQWESFTRFIHETMAGNERSY